MANITMLGSDIGNRTEELLPYYHIVLQPSSVDPEKTFVRDCVTINPPGKSIPRGEHKVQLER